MTIAITTSGAFIPAAVSPRSDTPSSRDLKAAQRDQTPVDSEIVKRWP